MRRRMIGSLLAVLLAAGGTFVLITYVRGVEDRALAGERVVPVLVVTAVVARGTPAEAIGDLVGVERVPAKVRAAGAVASLEDLAGKVAAVDLVPGEQLLAARFVSPADAAEQDDVQIPEGLQEVTVQLEPQRALGGRLAEGDTVGVISSFDPFDTDEGDDGEAKKTPNTTHLILHKVLVTGVQGGVTAAAPASGEGLAAQPAAAAGDLLVTLAVDARAAEKIVFTAEHGFLWLTAEPPEAQERPTSIETRGTIYE